MATSRSHAATATRAMPSSPRPGEAHWRHFHHDADIGVLGEGASMEQAFEQAAVALTAVITDPTNVRAEKTIELHAQAPDFELLLADWLNALIYAMATRHMLFSRFKVAIEGDQLHATAWGEAIDLKRHQPAVEIKGATYTELAVRRNVTGWLAQCVVDV